MVGGCGGANVVTAVSFQDAHLGELRGAQARLEPGMHVFWGTRSDGAADLICALSGAERLRRGKVTLDGVVVGKSPAARRSVASLLAEEPVLGTASVASLATQALQLAGETTTAELALALVGAEDLATRSHATLSQDQRRWVALGIALARTSAKVLALQDPQWACPASKVDRVFTALQQAADTRVVVVATADAEVASRLGGVHYLMRAGVIAGTATSARALAAWALDGVEVCLQTVAPAQVCALLSQSEEVTAALFDARSGEVSLRGRSLEALCEEITRVFHNNRLELRALTTKAPALHDVQRQFRTGAVGVNSPNAPPTKVTTSA